MTCRTTPSVGLRKDAQVRRLTQLFVVASIGFVILTSGSVLGAQSMKLRIVQNAMAGDAVSIIDPTTNKVIAQIPGIEISNGLAASPDGTRLYVTGEVARAVFVIDTKTMTVTSKVPTSGRPSAVAVSHDGRRLYVGIQSHGATGMDIIDATTLTKIKNLPLEGMRTHYVLVTPDGKYVMATANGGATEAEAVTLRLVDTKSEEYVRKIVGKGGGGHRACDFYPNSDGSTKWVFCNQGGLPGFKVYDFNTGEIVQEVTFPVSAREVKLEHVWTAQGSPSHGLSLSPDRRLVAVSDRWYNLVHFFSVPDLKHQFSVSMGVDPFWFAFTPDGKSVYVSASQSESVSVIDIEHRQEVGRIHVQAMPKRIIAAMVR
jgi:YVTN family beta-propeller protein